MNPVHSISNILEHTLVGHEEVAIFEASLTAEKEKGLSKCMFFICSSYFKCAQQQVCVQHLEYLEQLLKKSTKQAKRYVSERGETKTC